MSEDEAAGGHGSLKTATEGEFAGWSVWQSDAFEQGVGPFYERVDEHGQRLSAFRAELRHMNGAGFMHGGCLMTFADSALFTISRGAMDGRHGVTLSLSADFLDPVKPGQLIEARGEVLRGGGKTIFTRGLITADRTPVLRFNGVIRLIRS